MMRIIIINVVITNIITTTIVIITSSSLLLLLLLLLFPLQPSWSLRLTLGSVDHLPICIEQVIELSILSPLFYPNSYLVELQHEMLSLFSVMGPDWAVCLMSSTSAAIHNLHEVNHFHLGSASLCQLTNTRKSGTMY